MQIQRRRRESNSDPAKKSVPPDPRLSFSLNPSIHPFLPVSTAFAFYSHIKPPSLFPLRPFSLLNCLRVTLSHVSLNSFNPQFASDTSRRPSGEETACNRSGSEDCSCPHKHCVLFELFCQMKKKREKKENRTQAGLERNKVGEC